MSSEKKELLNKIDQSKELMEQKPNAKCVFDKELFDLDKNKFSIMKNIHDMNVVPHKHDFFQIEYVYSGKIVQYMNGKRVELSEGSIAIINKNVIHSINKGTSNDKTLHIGINESVLEDTFFNSLIKESTIRNYLYESLHLNRELNEYIVIDNINEGIKNLLKEMHDEYMDKLNGFEKNLTAYLILIFNKLHQQSIHKDSRDMHEKNDTKRRINKIRKYLNENYKVATLTSLADYIHVHPNYLSSFIREHTNKTFNKLLTDIRLKRACYLLVATESSIESISKEVGYKNQNYFYRLFKNEKKVTPREYRNGNRAIFP